MADPPGEVAPEADVGAGTDTTVAVVGGAVSVASASASAVVAVRVDGRFTTNAASAPATNRASTETAVPNHVEPSHRPPK